MITPGDADGAWVCSSYDLLVRVAAGDTYEAVVNDAFCRTNEWIETELPAQRETDGLINYHVADEHAYEQLTHALEIFLLDVEGLTKQVALEAEHAEEQAYLWMLVLTGFAFSAIPGALYTARNSGP